MVTILQLKHRGDSEQTDNKTADLLQQIVDSAEDIIFIMDENRSIRFSNNGFKAAAGFSRPGRPFDRFGGADIYEALREPAEMVFKSGKPLSIERRLGQPGREFWLHTRLTPITHGSGKISSVLGIARDISELKSKEKLIARSRAEWLQAVDAMPHLLAVIDLDYRIRKANRPLADHLGICLHDLHSRICHQTFGTKCPPELCPLQRSRPVGQSGPADFQSNILGRPFLVTVSRLADESGNTTGCLYVARDIEGLPTPAEIRKKNAEQMKLLLQRAEYLVTIQDRNGKYLSMRALPGNIRLPEDVAGKTPYDFFETGPARQICEHIEKTIGAGGGDLTVSSELKLAGETFHLLEHIFPVNDESGNITSVMTVSKRLAGVPEKLEAGPGEPQGLTKRERQILELISAGLTTNQMAEKLFISRKTVETHRARIMQKVGVRKTSALVGYAVRCGLF